MNDPSLHPKEKEEKEQEDPQDFYFLCKANDIAFAPLRDRPFVRTEEDEEREQRLGRHNKTLIEDLFDAIARLL
jgi:hypothetical protein